MMLPLRWAGAQTLSVTGRCRYGTVMESACSSGSRSRWSIMLTFQKNVGITPAGSTGRRNTGVKSLCWGFELQGLTWSFVQLTSHFVQMGLRMHRQVGAVRKVLSQQAIGVLVRPALPRALRIAKIDVDVGRQRKATMIRKFLAPVPGQGFI